MTAEVHQLQCSSCSRTLCDRGARVSLLADPSVALFSTDFVTRNALHSVVTDSSRFVCEQDDPYKIATCDCQIRNFGCKYCQVVVGYHVVGPCSPCLCGPNNGHYWMFHNKGVTSTVRTSEGGEDMKWHCLPAFPDGQANVVFANPTNDILLCPICYSVVTQPSVLPCGHTFCKVCITREVDIRKCCPVCRAQTGPQQIYPNLLVVDLVNELEVVCQYGTRQDEASGLWERDEEGCQAIVKYKAREEHERECSFRK